MISRRDFLRSLALLPLVAMDRLPVFATPSGARASRQLPNVLIFVFDALSAKNMSTYGYERKTTPNLDKFADNSTVYHAHYAGGNHTSPGVASILTGTYPWSHRALHLHGTVTKDYEQRNLFSLVAPEAYHSFGYSHNVLVTSLLHQFRHDLDLLKWTRDLCLIDMEFADRAFPNDYNAAFWSEWVLLRESESPPSSLFVSLLYRMVKMLQKRRLTKEYGAQFPKGLPNLHSLRYVLEDAVDWLGQYLGSVPRPFFGYVHVLPPHEPYMARSDFVDAFRDRWSPIEKPARRFSQGYSSQDLNQQRQEYDEYLAYADAEFGRLYRSLEQEGILDDSYVIVTADHGELFERGIRGHVTPTLYEPVMRVPLFISKPGQKDREDVHVQTSCTDLLPTLLHLVGETAPSWCEGRTLPSFGGGNVDRERTVFCVEAKSNPKFGPLTKGTVAMIKGQYKLIHYLGYGDSGELYELYDLANDPEEMEDLYPSRKAFAGELAQELSNALDRANR